ncbi:MAG: hypothetical protein WAV11_02625 [Minisyncoccia bacterium]
MAKEVADSVRSERMTAFLLKNGIVVKAEDLNRHWGIFDRNAMYFIWRNMRKKRLATIVNILTQKNVPIEYIGKKTELKSLGPKVELLEIEIVDHPVKPERMGQAGKKCPHCGYVDPASGSTKCPNCDTVYSQTEMEVENG